MLLKTRNYCIKIPSTPVVTVNDKISQILFYFFECRGVEALYACRIVTLNCFAYQQKWRSVVHLQLGTVLNHSFEAIFFIAGKWTAISALDYGMPVTLIGESVFARCLSSLKVRKWLIQLIIPPCYFTLTFLNNRTQRIPCPVNVTWNNKLSFAF